MMKKTKKKFVSPGVRMISVHSEDVIQTSYEFNIGQNSKNVLGGQNVIKGSDVKDIWKN